MKALRYFYLLFILNATGFFVYSQKQHLHFDHFGTDAGLSQGTATCILQDKKGFMWFGTMDGLNKYDGYHFIVYKHNEKDVASISNNYIKTIAEDAKGNLWIGTWGGGLNKFDRGKEKFFHYRHDKNNRNTISDDYITKITADHNKKHLWIGTESGGLNMFDPGINKFTSYAYNTNDSLSISNNFVTDIFEDHLHRFWIGTNNNGLNLFDEITSTFKHFQHRDNDRLSLSHNTVLNISEDNYHRLWIGTRGGGIDIMDALKQTFRQVKTDTSYTNLAHNVILSNAKDEQGNLWIGTENGGLIIIDPLSEKFTNYLNDEIDNTSLGSNSVYSVYKDSDGNMWIGTYNAGVDLCNKKANQFIHYKHTTSPESISNNNILAFLQDKAGLVWIGTDGGGLNLFNEKTGSFTRYIHEKGNAKSICGNVVLALQEDEKNNLWIGSCGDGVTLFNKEKNTFSLIKNNPKDTFSLSGDNVCSMAKDRDNSLWLGTYGNGLNLYDAQKKLFKHYKHSNEYSNTVSSDRILSIYGDKEGYLWIGTFEKGLDLFNKKNQVFTHFTHNDAKNSITDNTVNCIYEDRRGKMWIGTNSGLNCYDRVSNHFTAYFMQNGLPNDIIFSIVEDDKENFWISTNKGITQFNPSTNIFKNFSIADGLQSNEFKGKSSLKTSDGRIYFGGVNGFNVFSPGSIKDDTLDPKLVFTDLNIFNKRVSVANGKDDPSPLKKSINETAEITLSYKDAVITFEFASLNYIRNYKKQYAYMLKGFDKNWNDASTNHTATYTNLDPAEYTFKVRGINNEGKLLSHVIELKVIITPPFWLTWWFRILAVLILIAATAAFYRNRVNNINKQRVNLQQQVKQQTLQLLKSTEEEQKARRQAEKANIDLAIKNKEVEQFAYIASHDLQEPLRTTSSFITLIQKQYKGQLDERADKYFNYILDASNRMKVLIKNLLDYSRIGSKKDFEKVDCNAVMENVLADLYVAIREANATITCDPLPVISGYPIEIKQLFQNLLINAVKFRKKDCNPQINISVKKLKNEWEFMFKDNGIGIEEKHREKIFDIFQRLHSSAEYEGTGIGLSYCKKIVELHNGHIRVESAPGDGSTFYFTLSAKQVNDYQVKTDKSGSVVQLQYDLEPVLTSKDQKA